MSEKKKDTKTTENTEQKIVTKYDRKMQMRKEQKEREKRQDQISTVIGVIVVAALVCLVASFPIRTYLATHETYVTINGEKVTRVEFDYNYNLVKNNYINQYGSYMTYFGLNPSGDLSAQMYSETLTWQDYFEQMAVDTMSENAALKAQADAAGFTYDTTEEYKEYEQAVKDAAAEAGVSVKDYVQQQYGVYATLNRISPFIKKSMTINAFYNQTAEEKAPSEEEIQSYYEENTQNYDSVDFRLITVEAELPTEPTELADTASNTTASDNAANTDGAAGETDGTAQDAVEETYEPSEAEIEKAMADAKEKADAAELTVAKDGTLSENVKRASAASAIRDWLFDSARKAGDTTVIEDSTNNCYYVAAFEKRYLDETPSADVRMLITDTKDGQEILDEWNGGDATEESFGELCKQYSIDESSAENGGLYEAMVGTGMDENMAAWLYDTERKAGDTTFITNDSGYTYVMYYVGANDPEWKLSIKNTLLSQTMSDYLEEISADIQVEDPKGKLNYLKVLAQEAEAEESGAAASTEAAEGTEAAQDTETSDAAENTENKTE